METAFDLPDTDLDDDERDFLDKIREAGWFRTQVDADADGPGFSFTTGFWANVGQPEIIAFSLKSETAHAIFWTLFDRVNAGESLPVGVPVEDVVARLNVMLLPVAKRHYPEYLGWSSWFHRHRDFPCLQLVWPDRAGLFPWQAGFDEAFRHDQPDLSEGGWAAP